ncbi:hypothetical protein CPB86DRAFT_782549 [Serendipita vermifera]|nr:hypothetical protein CPB86DRAFT_782549 [Serendipita vermifera]
MSHSPSVRAHLPHGSGLASSTTESLSNPRFPRTSPIYALSSHRLRSAPTFYLSFFFPWSK